MSLLQEVKLLLLDHIGLAKDALHIYVGLLCFFGSALIRKWPLKSWKPWLVALIVVIIGEAWDLRDSVYYRTKVNLWGNWQDVWNTMFWPTIIMCLARWTKLFER